MHWSLILRVVLLALVFLPFAAQAQRLSENRAALVTAIIVGSAATQDAVEKSDEVIRRSFAEKRALEQRLVAALRRADLSDAARKRLEGELLDLRGKQAVLLSELAARSAEYAASLRAFREGLTGLADSDDPRVVTILQRYAEGNLSALNSLQDLVRIIRRARDAGLRARNAADQRGVALTWQDANARGQKTAAEVIAAWEEAAAIDPADFWQWIYIGRLSEESGDYSRGNAAAEKAFALAAGPWERSIARGLQGDLLSREARYEDAGRVFSKMLPEVLAAVRSDPESRVWGEGLSVLYWKIGQAAAAMDRYDEAARAYSNAAEAATRALRQFPGDRELERSRFVILMGDVELMLARGDYRAATEPALQALALVQVRLRDDASSREAQRDMLYVSMRYAKALAGLGQGKQAQKFNAQALDFARRYHASDRRSVDGLNLMITALDQMGDYFVDQDNYVEAQPYYKEIVALADMLQEIAPDTVVTIDALTTANENLGRLATEQRDLERAVVHFRRQVAIARNYKARSAAPRLLRPLAHAYSNLARAAHAAGLMSEAATASADGTAVHRKATEGLALTDPAWASLVLALDEQAKIARDSDDEDTALRAAFDGLQIRRSASLATPLDIERKQFWIYNLLETANLLIEFGRIEEGKSALGEARRLAGEILTTAPVDISALHYSAQASGRLADILFRNGQLAEALIASEDSLKYRRAVHRLDPSARRDLPMGLRQFGEMADEAGQFDTALSAYREAEQLSRAQLRETPLDFEVMRNLGLVLLQRGALLMRSDQVAQARTVITEAVTLRRTLVRTEPGEQSRLDLAFALLTNGDLARYANTPNLVANALLEAQKLLESAVGDQHETDRLRYLGVVHDRLGDLILSTGDRAKAVTHFRQMLVYSEALSAREPHSVWWISNQAVAAYKIVQLVPDRQIARRGLAALQKIGEQRALGNEEQTMLQALQSVVN